MVSYHKSVGVIYMVMDAEKALCMHLHDGYVMSNKTRWGTHYFEWPLQKQKAVAHLSKAPRKSLLIKAPPCPFIILLCIISMLQLSVAIRLAFFMQINLTAQQSVSYANSCLSFSPLHSLAPLPSLPLLPHFLWHLQRLVHLHYLFNHIRLEHATHKAGEYGY